MLTLADFPPAQRVCPAGNPRIAECRLISDPNPATNYPKRARLANNRQSKIGNRKFTYFLSSSTSTYSASMTLSSPPDDWAPGAAPAADDCSAVSVSAPVEDVC